MAKPLNLLIIEDSQDDADLIVRELRRAGFEPKWTRVETEPDFLAELKNLPDIILSDYSMPRFSGLRAAELTRKSGLEIPFILISGTVGEEVAVEAMKTGATDYLLKDRLARLGQAVERALRESREKTELQRAEKELQATQAQLNQLLEHSPAVIYSLKIEGQKIVPKVVSENIRTLLGFTVPEVLSYEWWHSHLHPEDRERAVAGLSETLAQGANMTEYRMRHKDGTYRWVEDTRRLIRDSSNQPDYFVGLWVDITERKRAEEILREANRNESAREKNKIIKELSVIFAVGAVIVGILAYTDALQPAANAFISKYQDHYDDVFSVCGVVLIGFLVFSYRRWHQARIQMGRQANIEEALRILQAELEKRIQQRTSELARANDVLRMEITERKKAEETLRESERRFNDMLGKIELVSIMLDREANIIYCNDYLLRTTGWRREEVLGRNWFDVFLPADRNADLRRLFAELIADLPAAWHFENDIVTRTGARRPIRWNNSVLRSPSGEVIGTASIGEDITNSKQLEEQLRQAQKMESIGQLAGGVAHDFNNILGVIQMQTDLLKIGGKLPPECKEIVDDISAAAQRAAALTRQLLLFSRKETMHQRDLDLNESINNMAKMLRRTLGENIQVQFRFAMQALHVRADAGMMDQVLMNLSVNSRDAMPNGGKLIIETSAAEFDEQAASQSAQMRAGSFVCLGVSDTGCGIPAENLARIFEPFFTTKEVGKGTGLGLATVFGIVQQHQGWINIYSEVGRGTTFRIYLPRLKEVSGRKAEAPPAASLPRGQETILLAEDDAFVRNAIRRTLSGLGYRMLEATNGAEALEVWKSNRDKIHLVLTDMVMPGGMTGKDLGERLVKDNPGLKVVYMSGYTAEFAGKDFPLEEGVDFLTKPFSSPKLAQTIRARLDR